MTIIVKSNCTDWGLSYEIAFDSFLSILCFMVGLWMELKLVLKRDKKDA